MLRRLASAGVLKYTIHILILSLILALVIGCLHILLAMYIKNVAGTIGMGFFITFLLEHLKRFRVGSYTISESVGNIYTHRWEFTPIYMGVCIVLIAVMLWFALKVFKTSELK